MAPEIYLGCVPIVRARDGRLAFGGAGEPVEWAVHMRRFDQAALLSRIAERGPLPSDLARDLAEAVLASHRTAPQGTPETPESGAIPAYSPLESRSQAEAVPPTT